ncbi:MAG: hypothetical protein RLZZ53_1906 [Acidobacteriota bacterium]|jgi:hypothetical protein
MTLRRAVAAPFGVIAFLLLSAPIASQVASAQSPDADLIQRVRDQVVQLQAQSPSLVAREQYKQTVSYRRTDPFGQQAASRELLSELLMVRLPGAAGWISFRDVLEVDGRKVGNREQRLVDLLQNPSPTALQQARQLAAESARYNIGNIPRTINLPDIALEFLSARHAGRMTFTVGERVRLGDQPAVMLRFQERTGPSIIRDNTGRDLLLSGRVWVEPASAALLRTELILRDRSSAGNCVVDFAVDERLKIRVPTRMTERYSASASTIDAVAVYSDYRRFGVSTDEKITKPPGVER